jgi:hydrocephalus-inducing protein
VPFKNVFSASTTFNFVVDNPAFIVKASEVIPSKKVIQVAVSFKPPGLGDGGKGDKTAAAQAAAASSFLSTGPKVGKLTVTSSSNNQVVWVYYLKLSP